MQNSPINFDLPKHLKNLEKRISVVENRRPGTIYLDKKIVTKDPETGVETVIGDLSDYGEDRMGIKQFINDVEPPPVPTSPMVATSPGLFTISWDGANRADLPQAPDFDHLNVYGSDGSSTLLVGSLKNKEEVVVSPATDYGVKWNFWFTSVDQNGNESTPSDLSLDVISPALVDSPDISDALSEVMRKAEEEATKAMTAANGKNRIWSSPSQPVEDPQAPFIEGDTWFDTDDGNKIYIWKTSPAPAGWKPAVLDSSALDTKVNDLINTAKNQSDTAIQTANGKNRAYHQSTAPSGTGHTVGDLWFDTGNDNRISKWDGSKWVVATVGSKAISDIVINSISAAQSTATAAKQSADGKNTNYYASTAPTAPTGGFKTGDTWFDTANGNRINRWDGSKWVAITLGTTGLSSDVITSINNAKLAGDNAQQAANQVSQDLSDAEATFASEILATSNAAKADATAKADAAKQAAIVAAASDAQAKADTARAEAERLWSTATRTYSWSGDRLDTMTVSSAWAITSVSDGMTGSVARKTGVGTNVYWDKNPIPFDPDALYRVSFRVRAVQDATNITTGFFYGGVHAWNSANQRIANTGAVATTNAHYFAGNARAVKAADGWVTATGYFRGYGAGSSGNGGAKPLITAPGTVHPDTRRISLMALIDYNNGDGIWDVASATLDVIPPEQVAAIVAAQSAADAAQAKATAAQTAAGSAQTTADSALTMAGSKSNIFYSTAVATGTGTRVDDIWRQRDATNQIIGEWRWTGSAWQKVTLTSGVFSNLDAGLLTAGTIQADRIGSRSITAEKIVSKALTANEIKAGSLTSASGIFGTLDASIINAGTLNSARLNAGDIRAKFLEAGKITAADMVAGTITADSGIISSLNAGVISSGFLDSERIKAGSITTEQLVVADATNFSTIDPQRGIDVMYPPSWATQNDGEWTTNKASSEAYLFFRDALGPIPFKSGDKFVLKFTGKASAAGTGSLRAYFYPTKGSTSGVAMTATQTVDLTTTAKEFGPLEFTVPNISAFTGSGTWTMGFFGTNARTISVKNVFILKMVDATVIAPDSITTSHMQANSITAASGIIKDLDASRISTGTMHGKYIQANTLAAEALAIGSFDNLIPEPEFNNGGASWNLISGTSIIPTGSSTGGPALRITANSSHQSINSKATYQVSGGESYKLTARFKSSATIPVGSVWIAVRARNRATGAETYPYVTNNTAIAANTWTTISDIIEVPDTTDRVVFFISARNTLTTGNLDVEFVSAVRATNTVLIKDGAISASKMELNSITATNGIIASLDASKIVTGTMDAKFITAGTITASRLAITSTDNLNRDPDMIDPNYWTLSDAGPGSGIVTTPTPPPIDNPKNVVLLNPKTAQSNMTLYMSSLPPENRLDVVPGDFYNVWSYVKSDAVDSTMTSVDQRVYFYNASGGILNYSAGVINKSDWTINSWNKVGGIVEVPANAVSMAPRLTVYSPNNSAVTTAKYWVTSPHITRAMDGQLVVEGAILANHIHTDAVEADKIKANAVTAIKINAGAVTTVKLDAEAVTAEKIKAGAVTTVKLDAEAVTADKIKSNAITSDKILSRAVIADKIAVGAIRAEHILAGEITTSKLAVTDFTELAPSLVSQADSWELVNNAVITDSTLSANGKQIKFTNTSGSAYAYGPMIPCQPDDKFYGSATLYYSATSTAQTYLRLYWYKKDKTASATAMTHLQGGSQASFPSGTKLSGNGVAPADAAYVRIGLGVTASPGDSAVYNLSCRRMTGGELIVDGSIKTDHLQAGSITTDKLVVADTTNSYPTPFYERGISWLTSSTGWNYSLAYNGGKGAIRYINSDSSTTYAPTLPNYGIPVTPDTDYWITAKVAVTGGSTPNVQMRVYTYDSAYNNTNGIAGSSVSISSGNNSYVEVGGRFTVPANAIKMQPRITFYTPVGSGEALYITEMKVVRMASAELIVQGAITADKLDVNAITGKKITGGTITGTTISGGTVTGTTINGGDLFMSSSNYSIEARTGGDGAYLGFRTPGSNTAGTIRATDEINIGGNTADTPTLTLRSPNSSGYPERGFIKMLSNKTANGGSNQPPIFTNMNLVFDHSGNGHVFGTNGLSLYGNGASLDIGKDSTSKRLLSTEVYERTYSGNANMYITPNGVMGRSTSALKYKEDVRVFDSLEYEDSLLSIETKTWVDKVEAQSYREYIEWEELHPFSPIPREMAEYPTSPPKRYFGAIADEFDSLGLTQFVTYGSSGEVEGLAYDKIGVALLPIVRRQKESIAQLKTLLDESMSRIEQLEQLQK